ncbi:response regulator [Ideonella azotifigens]|uniref:Response regulatory domain-containing protein n=1 Tax=Ideonella azotifigens TaxID=513160 RepID=A0ABN1KK26_9BURK|nr:response regulator [Ideonella azotifigens]MCD2339298.1 response regulator [Ideonella azotifigens]
MPHTLNAYLVEDSRLIRENLTAALEEMAAVRIVGWAEGESKAVASLAALSAAPADHELDLVLIDLMLQQGSGLGVLRAACGKGPGRHARCVVLTNYATPDMRRECLKLGADRVFDKSNEIDALIDYCLSLAKAGPPPTAAAAPV